MTFQEFIKTCKKGFDTGELRLSNGYEMTEKDYAIYWSICMLREDRIAKGEEPVLTHEEIYNGVLTYCGKEVFNRVFNNPEVSV